MIKFNVKNFGEFCGLFAGGFIFLIALNLLVFLLFGDVNIDLTADKKYSLSDETINFLDKNKEQINIKFFVSKDLKYKNPKLAEYAEYIRKLLVEYKNKSNGYIDLTMVDVVPFENSEYEAKKSGIEEFDFNDGIKYQYLGIGFSNMYGQFDSINQLYPNRKLYVEDDITRILSVIAEKRKSNIGIISSLFNIAGENNPIKSTKIWPFVKNLKKFGYNILPIRSTVPFIDDSVDVVLLFYPVEANTPLKYALDQYLVRGGSVVIMTDAFFEERFRNMEKYYSYLSGLTEFLKNHGVSYAHNLLVGDNSSRTVVMDGKKVSYPLKINITENMLSKHPINKNIDKIFYNHGSFFEYENQENKVMTVIAKTSDKAGVLEAIKITDLGYDDLIKKYKFTGKSHILSLLIEGMFEPYYTYPPINDAELLARLPIFQRTAQKEGKLLLIGDADIVNEVLWNADNKKGHDVYNITYSSDNLYFLRNIFDYMSDSNYANVGKKKIVKNDINIANVFRKMAMDFYEEYRKDVINQLYGVKEKLLTIEEGKTEFDAFYTKKLKEKEQVIREENNLRQSLRKIVYLIEEKQALLMMSFSVFVIFVLPLTVIILLALMYKIYNNKLVKEIKGWIND
ncbi:MAG: GldG family protein [Alphaproteobacteria bacterium]|nr:GldG family protein [Alphaproteobacteria bacterium]